MSEVAERESSDVSDEESDIPRSGTGVMRTLFWLVQPSTLHPSLTPGPLSFAFHITLVRSY